MYVCMYVFLTDLSNSPLQHHVLVIGATNHLDSLDSALRSAGRFEKEISLGVPDEKARKKCLFQLIFSLHICYYHFP